MHIVDRAMLEHPASGWNMSMIFVEEDRRVAVVEGHRTREAPC